MSSIGAVCEIWNFTREDDVVAAPGVECWSGRFLFDVQDLQFDMNLYGRGLMSLKPDSKVRLYATLPHTRVLGPYLRFAIWVQGCGKKCPGCMTPDAASFDGGFLVKADELAERIVNSLEIEGVTISGGEPFDQVSALTNLIHAVRARRDLGVIVYTGYTLDYLMNRNDSGEIASFFSLIDLLIDGPYVRELDDGLSLRGSSNQAVYCLSGRYAGVADQIYGRPVRKVEIHILDNELFLAGIPGSDMLNTWKERKITG